MQEHVHSLHVYFDSLHEGVDSLVDSLHGGGVSCKNALAVCGMNGDSQQRDTLRHTGDCIYHSVMWSYNVEHKKAFV